MNPFESNGTPSKLLRRMATATLLGIGTVLLCCFFDYKITERKNLQFAESHGCLTQAQAKEAVKHFTIKPRKAFDIAVNSSRSNPANNAQTAGEPVYLSQSMYIIGQEYFFPSASPEISKWGFRNFQMEGWLVNAWTGKARSIMFNSNAPLELPWRAALSVEDLDPPMKSEPR